MILYYSPAGGAINTEDPPSERKVTMMAQYAQSCWKPSSHQTQIRVQVMKFTSFLNMGFFLVNYTNGPWFACMTLLRKELQPRLAILSLLFHENVVR